MRYMIKGGYWKNVEDEMLKAGVMKYGLNQWSRLASLLPRKTAKQCKARWYEWLDPSIKKTEWTNHEEEKLLHLSKIFPSQWRTIAPLVGRTPHQCITHYEKLLDLAQGRENIENDPRKLRPGEIDPTPEVRPARADPIDMEDDDKEMIAEARVRIANVKGKKAKRKARERVIDEARRLAQLQKFRELRNAGVDFVIERKERNKKKEFDYGREIPMERVPVEIYDVGEEGKIKINDENIGNINITQFEGERRDAIERKRREEDLRKINRLKKLNLPQRLENLSKDPSFFIKKKDLDLPAPQLNDENLKKLTKLTKQQNLSDSESEEFLPTDFLLQETKKTSNLEILPIRTPRPLNNIIDSALEASYLKDPIGSTIYSRSENNNLSIISKNKNYTPNPYKRLLDELSKKSENGINLNLSKKNSFLNSEKNFSLNSVLKSNNYSEFVNKKDNEEFDYFYLNDLKSKKGKKILKKKLGKIFSDLKKPKNEVEIDLEYLDELQENVDQQILESNFEMEKKKNEKKNIFMLNENNFDGDEIEFLERNLNFGFFEDLGNIENFSVIQKKGYFGILRKIGKIGKIEKNENCYIKKAMNMVDNKLDLYLKNNKGILKNLEKKIKNDLLEEKIEIKKNLYLEKKKNFLEKNFENYLKNLKIKEKKIEDLLEEKKKLENYYDYIKELKISEDNYMKKKIYEENIFLGNIKKIKYT